jgi:hypothetical protein
VKRILFATAALFVLAGLAARGQIPGGGAGGNVTITSPVDGSGNVKVNCETGCNGSNASVAALTSPGGSAPASGTQLGAWNGTAWSPLIATANGLAIDFQPESNIAVALAAPPNLFVSGGNVAWGGNSTGEGWSDYRRVGGTAVLTGAGATGTGSARQTIAQDSTTQAGATPGRTYNTIAASQTTQALTGGSGGATGDYLGFCVVVPATTSPGAVTIYDNSTAVYSFAGGSSSVTTLISWSVPIGAVSVSGAWKVTTGTNVSALCTGKFT